VQLRTTAWITLFTLEDARAFHVDLEADCSTYSYTLTVARISCGQKETREENVILQNSYRFYNAVDTIGCLLLQTGDVRRFPNRETDPETYQDLDMIEKDFDDLILLRNLYLE
jgi:5-enolpyruvylshikimate-3-phosphate synthase